MADRKIVQDQKFIYGWDDVANTPVFSSDHGATWNAIGGGGGVDVDENGVLVLAAASTINIVSDEAGGRLFGEVSDNGSGGADIEIDKQLNYLSLAGSVGPVPTGFSFNRLVYRACEVIYIVEKDDGKYETGHIMMLHDGLVAGVVVTRRGTELLPFLEGDPLVSFSADVLLDECRLLYTESGGVIFDFAVKPRPIRLFSAPSS